MSKTKQSLIVIVLSLNVFILAAARPLLSDPQSSMSSQRSAEPRPASSGAAATLNQDGDDYH